MANYSQLLRSFSELSADLVDLGACLMLARHRRRRPRWAQNGAACCNCLGDHDLVPGGDHFVENGCDGIVLGSQLGHNRASTGAEISPVSPQDVWSRDDRVGGPRHAHHPPGHLLRRQPPFLGQEALEREQQEARLAALLQFPGALRPSSSMLFAARGESGPSDGGLLRCHAPSAGWQSARRTHSVLLEENDEASEALEWQAAAPAGDEWAPVEQGQRGETCHSIDCGEQRKHWESGSPGRAGASSERHEQVSERLQIERRH